MKIARQTIVFDARRPERRAGVQVNGDARLGFQVHADPAGHPFCLCRG